MEASVAAPVQHRGAVCSLHPAKPGLRSTALVYSDLDRRTWPASAVTGAVKDGEAQFVCLVVYVKRVAVNGLTSVILQPVGVTSLRSRDVRCVLTVAVDVHLSAEGLGDTSNASAKSFALAAPSRLG